jgi:hypothetical protein
MTYEYNPNHGTAMIFNPSNFYQNLLQSKPLHRHPLNPNKGTILLGPNYCTTLPQKPQTITPLFSSSLTILQQLSSA